MGTDPPDPGLEGQRSGGCSTADHAGQLQSRSSLGQTAIRNSTSIPSSHGPDPAKWQAVTSPCPRPTCSTSWICSCRSVACPSLLYLLLSRACSASAMVLTGLCYWASLPFVLSVQASPALKELQQMPDASLCLLQHSSSPAAPPCG